MPSNEDALLRAMFKAAVDAADPRLARDRYMSCASCHHDGGHDGRVWDLSNFGEGLRNTISLRGRGGAQGRLHWSANFDEVQDFEGQIRTLPQGTGLMTDAQFATGTRSQPLGDRKAGEPLWPILKDAIVSRKRFLIGMVLTVAVTAPFGFWWAWPVLWLLQIGRAHV